MKGIDVSSYQGNIDWNKVKNAGYQFAILRLGIGDNVTSQDDKKLKEYLKGCQENGIPYAFYFVSYAKRLIGAESVASEITHTERLIQGTKPFGIFYDMEIEDTISLGKNVLTNFAVTYCDHFKKMGYQVGIYANKNWFTNYLDYDKLKNNGYKIWLAHYGIDKPSLECDIWQYSDKGNVEGINTNTTDLNIMYNESLLNVENNEKSTDDPQSNVVNAYYCVKTLKHGWLPEVKNLEDYAGYQDSPIVGLAIRVDKGSIKYRVHIKGGQWLPYVTGYDINQSLNGWAGNGLAIDMIEVYYNTPNNIRPYKKAKYKVNNYDWQYDNETKNNQDGYAGLKNVNAVKFQLVIE